MGWVARQKREYFFASLLHSGTQVEVNNYDININYVVEEGRFQATAVVRIRALASNVTRHCFVLNSGLNVDSIRLGETELPFREREFTDVVGLKAVWVFFPKPLDEDDELEVTFVYSGRPVGKTGVQVDDDGMRLSRKSAWYPVGAGFNSFTARVTCVTSPGFVSVSDGELISFEESDDRVVYVWDVEEPISGLGFTSGKFEMGCTIHRGVKLELYLGQAIRHTIEPGIRIFCEVLDAYIDMLGEPPVERFSSVLRRQYSSDEQEVRMVTALGHEMAHVWWGSPISVGFDHTWFHESLARVMAYETVGRVLGRDAEFQLVREEVDRWAADATLGPGGEESVLLWAKSRAPYAPRPICIRTALTLRLLRYTLGEEMFFRILRKHLSLYRGKPSGLRDFVMIAESESEMNVGRFMRQWLGNTASFAYQIESAVCSRRSEDRFATRLHLVNTGDAHSPVNADVLLAGDDEETCEQVKLTGRNQVLYIVTNHPVNTVVLDPGAYLPNISWRNCRIQTECKGRR
ncbi:MAG: M1 family aminopeptidase [Bacillota bacterium]|nr:M1 family aminopeptidase [Bacillota bacterium]